ncbi:N-acetyltransferase [Levilactobacillus bambusae]|nr:N-acetyltransferase [Levilactobacillus bambusae]
MGFLSLQPDLKSLPLVQSELSWYTESHERALFLWRDNHDNYNGVIGVELSTDFVVVNEMSLTPAANNETDINTILDELDREYPDQRVMCTLPYANEVMRWEQAHE